MPYETYSKRQRRLKGGNDVYVYDIFPEAFRIQVVYIWELALGEGNDQYSNAYRFFKLMVEVLRREFGVFELPVAIPYRGRTWFEELRDCLLHIDNGRVLDIVELSARVMDKEGRGYQIRGWISPQARIDAAIKELNARFKEHSLGYQYTNEEIVRIDSELIHAEVVKPVLKLLNRPGFKGAEDEYLKAHEHYRHGNAKEALAECLKAFESAMVGICKKRNWAYTEKDNAKTLIGICLNNKLIPSFWESHFTGLRATLEGGIPTGRNKLAGHGQGEVPVEVPSYLVSYVMHMTAATLKMLVEADEALG